MGLTPAGIGVAVGVAVGFLTGSPGFGAAFAIGVFMGLKGRSAERRPGTARELMAELDSDPEWVAARQGEQSERERNLAAWTTAEAPLVADLRDTGLDVTTAWDLVNTADPYPEAIPILLRHLEFAYPDRVREGIARALAVPDARPHWDTLRRLFEAQRPGTDTKDGLAVALAASCDEGVLLDLLTLLREPRHGDSRLLLLRALERSGAPDIPAVLEELGQDPVLTQEVSRLKRRRMRRRGPAR